MRDLIEEAFQDELLKVAFVEEAGRRFAAGFLDEIEKLGMDKEAFIPLIPLAAGVLATTGMMAGIGAASKPKGMSWSQWMPAKSFGQALGHNAEIGSYLYGGGALARGVGAAARVGGAAAKAPGLLGRAGAMFKDVMGSNLISNIGERLQGAAAPAVAAYRPATISGMNLTGGF